MTSKVKKTEQKRDIDLDIENKFETIDQYLPRNYTEKVISKLEKTLPDVTPGAIKQTKYARSGNVQIIAALYEVAYETKELLKQ